MWLIGLLAGLVLAAIAEEHVWLACALAGAVLGWLIGHVMKLEAEVTRKLAELNAGSLPAAPKVAAEEAAPQTPEDITRPEELPSSALPQGEEAAIPQPQPLAAVREGSASPSFIGQALDAARRWLFGGNTVVRVGVVILFFGVAFLLKYAYEHAVLPIELRLAGVMLGAGVLLVIGWRLRLRRPAYALSLQGAGVGSIYLVVFAALRLYQLIPPLPALVLLIAVAALSAVLALLQDSLALAAVGASGGFLAPILASTGEGSHVMLFSYYLVLNLGILAIAYAKAWRALNLVGLAFTFAIGSLWGMRFYRPELWPSTEPFLIAEFLLYVAIAVLFARRQALALKHYVDGTLVFGVPLLAFGLQAALVRDFEYGAAWSAAALGLFYVGLASAIWRRAAAGLRLLAESFLALGLGFGTLAIPLAFDGRVTSAAWALEGAAIVWVGLRQHRPLARAFGLLLQVAAGTSFALAMPAVATTPWLNSGYFGCLFIALGGLFCARSMDRHGERLKQWEQAMPALMLAWGTLWWMGGGVNEIDIHFDIQLQAHAQLIYVAVSALGFSLAATLLSWPRARFSAYLVVLAAAITALRDLVEVPHPFAYWGFAAWPLAVALGYALLKRHDSQDRALQPAMHVALLLSAVLVGAGEGAWQLGSAVEGSTLWSFVIWGVVPALALGAMTNARLGARWPLAGRESIYLVAAAVPLALFLLGWTLQANFTQDGDAALLPYLPLLNPLDLAQVLGFLAMGHWWQTVRRLACGRVLETKPSLPHIVFFAALFIWANGVLLRSLHQWADVPFQFDAMFGSILVQSALSIFWSLMAFGLMVLATRRARRGLWIAGAALMAVVVLKLFLIDLSSVGSVERIVSFIGVGVLMLVIGYFSPVPPKQATGA